MNTRLTTTLIAALCLSGAARLPAETLEDVQRELALTQAKLAVAEARLALAKKEQELAALNGANPPAPAKPAAADPPSAVPSDDEFELLKLKREAAKLEGEATAQAKAVEAAGPDAAKKAAAEQKLKDLKTALTANQLKQDWLTKKAAAAAAAQAAAADGAGKKEREQLARREKERDLAQAAYAALEKQITPESDPHFKTAGAPSYFHAGVRQLSPFKLRLDDSTGTKRGFLDKDDNGLSGYFEFVYSNRWAWNQARIDVAAQPDTERKAGRHGMGTMDFSVFDLDAVDFEAKIGFGLKKDAEIDATAIAGSGEVGVELTAARHIYRDQLDGRDGHFSINLETSYGLTTDRNAYDAHQRFFAGLSYTGSYPGWGDGDGAVLFNLRGGYISLDAVQFIPDTERQIELQFGDLPAYRRQNAWALEADIVYPLRADAYLTLGARVTGGLDPNPWTVYVGYTLGLGKIAKALLPGGEDRTAVPAESAGATPKLKTPQL